MEGKSPGWRGSQLDGGVINPKEKGNQEKQSGLLNDSTNSLFPPRETFFAFYHDAIWKLHGLASEMTVEDTQGKADWYKQYTILY